MRPERGGRPVRIANCSGFYGDRLSAPAELLSGPEPIDVLTGDYLSELTMLICWKLRERDPGRGYAATFLRQAEQVLGTCAERSVRVVTNAGGLNPRGLASELAKLSERLGVQARVAVVEGDDLSARLDGIQSEGGGLANMDTGTKLAEAGSAPLTANAYLGGWGIATALEAGADVVVCGRVTDASLVLGPAAWWHGWGRRDWDRLAGAVVAGHIVECGTQCTGGNYPFLDELPPGGLPGFPVVEVDADGSCVVTKQTGTGGVVNVGTVTAQLLYEIGDPAYANPDVVARFDTIQLAQEGPDRVRVSGARGAPPPDTLKAALNFHGGYRNTMTMVLTGLDVPGKAALAERLLFESLGGREEFGEVDVQLVRSDREDAPSNEQAAALLRVTVKDDDAEKAGRRFTDAVVQLALSSYAGFFATTPPGAATAFGVYWPVLVPASAVDQQVVLPGGEVVAVEPSPQGPPPPDLPPLAPQRARAVSAQPPAGRTERRPLGEVCGARSGDKGGNANIGVWARDPAAYGWLAAYLTVGRFQELVPEARPFRVERYELANLSALNFVVHGILGDGVASSARFDPQAKGLGEYLRSRVVDVPPELLRSRAHPGSEV